MENKLLTGSISACNTRSMSTKRRIKILSNKKACNNFSKKQHATEKRLQFCNFSRYAFEAFLLLFLFFTLPHTVNGITNEIKTSKQNIVGVKSFSNSADQFQNVNNENKNEAHFLPNRTVIVELFEWKFVDVSAECTNFLGPKGYAGVQLSPVTEHLLGGVQAQSWLARYQPISFKFATRSGSVEDFLAMSRACNAAGIRVYVDVVLNHMAGDTTLSDDSVLVGTAGSIANISTLDYNGVPFEALDFHKACVLENYFDSYEVRNCQLNGQPDLNHSRVTVQERIVEFLNQLIDMGVAGFRIDSAKYMWPNELKAIYEAVNNLNSADFGFEENSRPIFYQEIVDLGIDAVSKTEYSNLGIVTEYLYAAELSTIFRGKVPLSSLINWGPAMGFLQHQDALVFVDTHESQHGYLEHELGKIQLLSYNQQRRYIMATAFMLAHPYGRIKRILSSYNFPADDKERGPPTVENNNTSSEQPNILSPEIDSLSEQCTPTNGWICEHRWPSIVNMLALANVLSETEDGVIDFQTYGPNHIAFCRGQKAFIAINNDLNLDYTTTVHTCLEPGIYCDVISGGRKADVDDCQGKRIVVKENGMADLMLPALGATENIAIDNVDNVDGEDVNENSEWKGATVDVDYGVIAIYIGSKLLNSDNRVWNSEAIEQSKPEIDLKATPVTTESNAEISDDEVQAKRNDSNSHSNTVEDQKTVDEVVEEETNTENAVEETTEEVMKSNAEQCTLSSGASSMNKT